jgi:hypothetical protein
MENVTEIIVIYRITQIVTMQLVSTLPPAKKSREKEGKYLEYSSKIKY